jgi:hypothetical protein
VSDHGERTNAGSTASRYQSRVTTTLGGAVTLARLFGDGILTRWLEAILLERDAKIVKGSAAEEFINIPLCCD